MGPRIRVAGAVRSVNRLTDNPYVADVLRLLVLHLPTFSHRLLFARLVDAYKGYGLAVRPQFQSCSTAGDIGECHRFASIEREQINLWGLRAAILLARPHESQPLPVGRPSGCSVAGPGCELSRRASGSRYDPERALVAIRLLIGCGSDEDNSRNVWR